MRWKLSKGWCSAPVEVSYWKWAPLFPQCVLLLGSSYFRYVYSLGIWRSCMCQVKSLSHPLILTLVDSWLLHLQLIYVTIYSSYLQTYLWIDSTKNLYTIQKESSDFDIYCFLLWIQKMDLEISGYILFWELISILSLDLVAGNKTPWGWLAKWQCGLKARHPVTASPTCGWLQTPRGSKRESSRVFKQKRFIFDST